MKSMASAVLAYLLMGLIVLGGQIGRAESEFSFDGQIRLRNEYDLKSTDHDRHSKVFHPLRTRVGLKFEPTDQAFVYVQLQDSRILGDPTSGDISATDNVDLHQAFFEIKDAVFDNMVIRGGRFEINYGNQRVFGSVGWSNIGRSWEGGLVSYRPDNLRMDLFLLKRMERDDNRYDRDFDIFGLYGTIEPANLDLFWFYELNRDSTGFVAKKLKRHNIGFYYFRNYRDFDFTLQGNYQVGEKPPYPLPSETVEDIKAYMIAYEMGYAFYGSVPGRIAAGIDYTSGDDNPHEGEITHYENAYYTAHKFQGYMDYFKDSPEHGLMDIMLRGELEPARRWQALIDIHYFKAAEDYISKADRETLTRDIGVELDLTVIHRSVKGATFTGGFSAFSADEDYSWDGADREIGVWSYLMFTVNF